MKKYVNIVLVALFVIIASGKAMAAGDTVHIVQPGDSLWQIAMDNGVTVEQLQALNNLAGDNIKPGDAIVIRHDNENAVSASPTSGQELYCVQKGDCLSTIAARFGITVQELIEMNTLQSDLLKPGDMLAVGQISGSPSTASVTTAATLETTEYTVQNGDCLSGVAASTGNTIAELITLNQLENDLIYPGQKLMVSMTGSPEVSRSGGGSVDRSRIVETAARYLGTPYKYGGNSPGGFDCSGFVQYILNNCGYSVPRTASAQKQMGQSIGRDELLPGDLVFFACWSSGVDHVGIYTGDNKFIHSSSPRSGGVIYSSLNESFYARTYVAATRIVR